MKINHWALKHHALSITIVLLTAAITVITYNFLALSIYNVLIPPHANFLITTILTVPLYIHLKSSGLIVPGKPSDRLKEISKSRI